MCFMSDFCLFLYLFILILHLFRAFMLCPSALRNYIYGLRIFFRVKITVRKSCLLTEYTFCRPLQRGLSDLSGEKSCKYI